MKKFTEFIKEEKESTEPTKYEVFFNKKLEKFSVKSVDELSKEDKEIFFKEIEDEWETPEEKEEKEEK